MYQFFVEEEQIGREFVTITGSDVNHIKHVLRMKPGEKIRISSREGRDLFCVVSEVADTFVQADILNEEAPSTELSEKIYLFQGIPKGDRMETVIEKAVELGAYEVVPVAARRCVARLDEKKALSRINRWQGIAEAAAKQSRRGIIPQVHPVMNMREAVAYAHAMEVKLIPYELAENMGHTKEILEAVKPGTDIAVFIGPEGGFEQEEIELATAAGIEPVTLGRRILRTETAGLTVLSWLMYHLES